MERGKALEKDESQDQDLEQQHEEVWKEAWETLDRLRVMLHKEMSDWAVIQRRVDDLYMRASKDPKAAQAVVSLEAALAECRGDVEDAERRMQQLQALVKEMNLRSAQDRREMQRYKKNAFGLRGGEENEKNVPATPRAEDTAVTPKRKRVRRFA